LFIKSAWRSADALAHLDDIKCLQTLFTLKAENPLIGKGGEAPNWLSRYKETNSQE
jgi:hypothetical protein